MFLYVTEKINSYHKIGIAENIHERLNNFRTLIPDLNLNFYIPLPNRKIGELIERTLKKHLNVYRLKKSECYGLTIQSIKKVITGYTLLTNYCVIDYNINPIDYPYELSQFDERRTAWETSRGRSVIFLNEIYFGEKIPLFALEKVKNNQTKIKVIDKLNSIKELGDLCSKLESVFEDYKVSLKNPLFEYLKDQDNKEINIKENTLPIVEYFSPIIWEGLIIYLNTLREMYETDNVRSINKSDSNIYENFPFECLGRMKRNKNLDMSKREVIPGSFLIDINKLVKIGNLFGKP
mgnify:FL=1